VKERFDKPGNVFLGLVQRLDRPATGVMVLARTSKAAPPPDSWPPDAREAAARWIGTREG
jgi:hypothetical protein